MRYLFSLILLAALCGQARAAYIDMWRGEVDLKRAGKTEWARLEGDEKVRLGNGDELRTARASTVEILMEDGTKVKLAPVSAFKMSSESKDAVSLGLYFGRVRSWVKKFSKKFEVRTPSAVCAVRGTDFMVASDEEGNSRVEVYDGSVLAGDSKGNSSLVRGGQAAEIPMGARMGTPRENPNQPGDMNSSIGNPSQAARNEIYGELSKEDVVARAQEEMQSSEFQNRKVAVDAFGNRVRMEEYTIRPSANQFKYVVLNTRDSRFDFGKILFTFNSALPSDLSLVTANMISAAGTAAPQWYLTAMNSVMSNTLDKVTEDASGGIMQSNGSAADPRFNLVFGNYSFYAAGPDTLLTAPNDSAAMGKWIWTKSGYNVATGDVTSASYLGTTGLVASVTGDAFHSISRNTFNEGTYIQAEDFVIFDDGKILSAGDFGAGLGGGETLDQITDRLNFERVYTSNLFSGRNINLVYSAKLLKDAGLLRLE
ncbi:MAG: hypothetical protein A2X35_13055 [Elusimicrobia bacterium GWA2_61_42]|nr:MAG: hypothetical protein A2X35_13055 [Elusimicrobia bacterium GWA2_61_42]OGR77469.1 MAG: hypothetical protein A2X38_10325 [Elusimicrobia bacterium GWC2_61_25]